MLTGTISSDINTVSGWEVDWPYEDVLHGLPNFESTIEPDRAVVKVNMRDEKTARTACAIMGYSFGSVELVVHNEKLEEVFRGLIEDFHPPVDDFSMMASAVFNSTIQDWTGQHSAYIRKAVRSVLGTLPIRE